MTSVLATTPDPGVESAINHHRDPLHHALTADLIGSSRPKSSWSAARAPHAGCARRAAFIGRSCRRIASRPASGTTWLAS
jgi:hypothetical protein